MHPSAPPSARRGRESERPKVLIVDDDPISLQLLKEVLETEFDIRETSSSVEAKEMIEEGFPFCAVVCDLQMPEMDGIALLRRIREKDAELPVIILTGEQSLDVAVKVMEYRGFRYLVKPFDHVAMLSAVRAATATRKMDLRRRRAFELYESHGPRESDVELDRQLTESMMTLFTDFQPIVELGDSGVLGSGVCDGGVFGYEALLRSRGPRLTTPDAILRVAESLGRVRELGRSLRSRVARSLESAPAGATVFVNLHPLDLGDDELYARYAPLSRYSERVVFEITERAHLGSLAELSGRLDGLRDMGYRIAIDDLGAGYSGLASFSELRPDIVKLDMSLIRDIDKSPRKRSIVKSLLGMCLGDLDTRVVCEGVETIAEFETLRDMGADLLQGYLIARPEPAFKTPDMFWTWREGSIS